MSKHLRIHYVNVLRTKFYASFWAKQNISPKLPYDLCTHGQKMERFMCLPGSSLFEFDYILPEKIPQTVTCANFNENGRVNFPDEFHVTKSYFLVKNFPAVYGFQPYNVVKTVRHLSLPWAVSIQCSGTGRCIQSAPYFQMFCSKV
jgi:hypothetical protein